MNKFFKFLGIGTAIGTIAYGIIKYKHDEKFKEKVDGVIEKAEEKASKVMDKTLDFSAKHPVLTTVAFAAVIFTPIIAIRRAMAPTIEHYQNVVQSAMDDYYDEECERINEQSKAEAEKQMMIDEVMSRPSDYLVISKEAWESCQKAIENKPEPIKPPSTVFDNWKEDYRDGWDEVHELTKRIDLAPGESYMIEEAGQLGLETDQPVISHMIYGKGCYPPEIKDDQFIP